MKLTCKRKVIISFFSGLALTVIILISVGYYLLQNMSPFSGFDENLKERIATSQLDDILEKVEVFNLVNDRYPNDLAELRESTMQTSMYIDPESQKPDCAFEYYYLHNKEASSYILLSVGKDKILFSEDDIWPTFARTEFADLGIRNERESNVNYPEVVCYEWDM